MSKNPKKSLLSIIKSFKDIGIYAKDLEDTKTITFNENKLFITASCYKVITAIALYHKLEKEGIKDANILPFRTEDRVGGSGILKMMKPCSNSIYNYLVLMLKLSDNTATNIIENYVTMNKQQEIIKKLELKKTKIRLNIKECCYGNKERAKIWTPEDEDAEIIRTNAVPSKEDISLKLSESNVSTPYELCKVLEELVNPTLISKESADKIINIMKQYDPDERIIEFGKYIEIANKRGWAASLRADMNIVFSENPFYLVMMAKNLENQEWNRLVDSYNEIVKLAIDYFNN